jgi:hypothetical protein
MIRYPIEQLSRIFGQLVMAVLAFHTKIPKIIIIIYLLLYLLLLLFDNLVSNE